MTLTASLVGSVGTSTGFTVSTGAGDSETSLVTFAALVSYNQACVTFTVSDNKGNTYTPIGTPQDEGLGGFLRWFVCENGVGGAGHVFSFSCVTDVVVGTAHLVQIVGTAGYPELDKAVQGVADATQPYDDVSTGVLSAANEIILGGVSVNYGASGDYSSNNGTLLSTSSDNFSYYTSAASAHSVSSSASFAPSFSNVGRNSGPGALAHVTFLESGAAIPIAAISHYLRYRRRRA